MVTLVLDEFALKLVICVFSTAATGVGEVDRAVAGELLEPVLEIVEGLIGCAVVEDGLDFAAVLAAGPVVVGATAFTFATEGFAEEDAAGLGAATPIASRVALGAAHAVVLAAVEDAGAGEDAFESSGLGRDATGVTMVGGGGIASVDGAGA